MDHPGNPNHPSAFHVREDGWMGASLTFKAPITIEPGKRADFTALTADPRSGEDCEVVATFVSGKCIYKNDRLSEHLQLEE